MLTIEGTESTPQLWVGGSLRKFGINPYGEPLFRVVRSSTITFLVGGKHTVREGEIPNDSQLAANQGRDNSIRHEWVGYKHYPKYAAGYGAYVLEVWLSPFEFCKTTPEGWALQFRDEETGLLTLGPYPSRGVYEYRWDFGQGYPTVQAVESIIGMLIAGGNYTAAEKKAAILKSEEKDKLDRINRGKEIILESLPAHGFNPSSSHTGKKRPEDYKMRYSAQDLGLPVGNNKVFTRRSK